MIIFVEICEKIRWGKSIFVNNAPSRCRDPSDRGRRVYHRLRCTLERWREKIFTQMFTRKGKFDGQIVNFNKTSRLNQVFFLSLLTNYRRNKRETRFLKLASPSSPPPSSPPSPPIIVVEKILATIEKIIDRDKNRKIPLPSPLSFYFSTRSFFYTFELWRVIGGTTMSSVFRATRTNIQFIFGNGAFSKRFTRSCIWRTINRALLQPRLRDLYDVQTTKVQIRGLGRR